MKIILKQVSFYYNQNLPSRNRILHNINLEFGEREFVGIIGHSGSGKTTLIQHSTGLLQPTGGQILIDGKDISDGNANLDHIRKQIGIAFQFPESQLFEETVYDDVAFGPRNFGITEELIEKRARAIFDLLGIDFTLLKSRPPFRLSEGEKRKVALAGILAMDPEVLVLDEPTACLDATGVRKIEQLLRHLHDTGKSIILVSHNLDFLCNLCDRIVALKHGEIAYDGSKNRFFETENWIHQLDMEEPRIIRLGKRLYENGIIDKKYVYSLNEFKSILLV